MLGAVAGGDVVLGDQNHQIGMADELMDFFGLALGDEGTEWGFFCGWGSGVHGAKSWLLGQEGPARIGFAGPITKDKWAGTDAFQQGFCNGARFWWSCFDSKRQRLVRGSD
jgi:hypothetical protein